MAGPLAGIRIVELAGIGPGPFACMMLADHGAEVIRIIRPGEEKAAPGGDPRFDILQRSRRTVVVDLKTAEGVAIVRKIAATCDGLVEGYRPGVAERLGLGPDELIGLNPRLVYGRMTGWGQTGPYAHKAGHDINYIALAGALHGMGRAGEKPTPPINLVGDFGGGGMMLAFAMVSALLHARSTGEGQVIDCAMTEGAALLMSMIWSFRAQGAWRDERGVNLLDTGAHFYDSYETRDGHFISLGSIEPQFYARLLDLLGLSDDPGFARQHDPAHWNTLRDRLTVLFRERTRDEWCALMETSDLCFAPVLSMQDALTHPHNVARQTFIDVGGVVQPAPAPRYSHTVTATPSMFDGSTDSQAVLAEVGYSESAIQALRDSGTIA